MSNECMPVTPEAQVFGKTLKRLREERNLSQERLANHPRLGNSPMTTNYVSDLERGVKVPSLTTILKLAHALGCAPAELLSDFTPTALRRIVQ